MPALVRAARGQLALENFSPVEIACRGTGTLLVNEAALGSQQGIDLAARALVDPSPETGTAP